MNDEVITQATELIKRSRKTAAFTGAGISVESGIPPFRGADGLWSKYDPRMFEINYFYAHAEKSWSLLRKLFYDTIAAARPNPAHEVLAWLEQRGWLAGIVTQNIDNLHYDAGSQRVIEYHGNTRQLYCRQCNDYHPASFTAYGFPPRCPSCREILKPDFVFFGEAIPAAAIIGTEKLLRGVEVTLVIGTTGVIYPAAAMPYQAARGGATIVEINVEKSEYTDSITDLFIEAAAAQAMLEIKKRLA